MDRTGIRHICIAGAGAWGIALAIHAAGTGARVTLCARSVPQRLPSGALPRLPDIPLPQDVRLSSVLPEDADLILVAVPMQALSGFLPLLPDSDVPVVLCCKGIEQTTLRLPLEVLHDFRPDAGGAVLSGPNFAGEIAAGLPAATVIAGPDRTQASAIATALTTPQFRCYASDDPTGVQIGGAAKNVIAIAAGITTGAELGENARAGLITRGLAEISRLAVAAGGRAETLAGLSGIGDLLLTCTGTASRNFRTGIALGKGFSPEAARQQAGGTAEGVHTCPALLSLAARHGIRMPVTECVHAILEGTMTAATARETLLSRPAGMENGESA
ncbi:NAD(P)-dependent glycerol-3-phosphate dehydrogenase [Acetobacter sp. AN02]|uniref:NAD(P)H-dependent glycerol-3-phosphate dehydrogenase n=1 Tax=Acetobacter sp. AN02 TaxID=2894186 RepID=UPI0024345F1B|nr:NAD(P)-dependent glycerol-3-phosphate dehydrogenase [Acetobacter sp. AN02]MDG6094731.1 NAD(P)-dependent glycerol-3-phosphate dehydrogenase [Acetobacter sp. AN02]